MDGDSNTNPTIQEWIDEIETYVEDYDSIVGSCSAEQKNTVIDGLYVAENEDLEQADLGSLLRMHDLANPWYFLDDFKKRFSEDIVERIKNDLIEKIKTSHDVSDDEVSTDNDVFEKRMSAADIVSIIGTDRQVIRKNGNCDAEVFYALELDANDKVKVAA